MKKITLIVVLILWALPALAFNWGPSAPFLGTGTTPTFKGLSLLGFTSGNVFNSASGFTGNLIDIQVNGSSKFYIDQTGAVTAPASIAAGTVKGDTINSYGGATNSIILNNRATSSANLFGVTLGTGTLSQTSGTNGALKIAPIYNQASGNAANSDLQINRTETAIGSGLQRLISAGTGGGSYVEKFGVDNVGHPIIAVSATPASGSACTAGTLVWDASYIYVCTASGAWKRSALTGGY